MNPKKVGLGRKYTLNQAVSATGAIHKEYSGLNLPGLLNIHELHIENEY